MACPKCNCKVTYCYTTDDVQDDYDMERCANCGTVFYLMDAADEDNDYTDIDYENDCRGQQGERMKLTVIIRDERPFIHLQEPCKYRTVHIELTNEQIDKLNMREGEDFCHAFFE